MQYKKVYSFRKILLINLFHVLQTLSFAFNQKCLILPMKSSFWPLCKAKTKERLAISSDSGPHRPDISIISKPENDIDQLTLKL